MPLCLSAPHGGKFNTISNDYERTQNYDFSVLDREYPFWVNLAQKIKVVSLCWDLAPKLIQNMQNSLEVFTFSFLD